MDSNVQWYLENKVERTIVSLKKQNVQGILRGEYSTDHDIVPGNSLVAIGNSMTPFETGVIE